MGLRRAIGLALVAHVLAALAMRAAPPLVSPPPVLAPEAAIEIEAVAEESAVRREEPAATSPPTAFAAASSPIVSSRLVATAAVVSAAVVTGDADAGWFDPVQNVAAPPTLLGRRVELAPTPTRESAPRSDGAVTAVRDALDAHDQSVGLGRAGPLQAAAHEAASAGPDTGVGQLEIVCDANGNVMSVRTEQSDWQPVATRLARAMVGKTLRVRPGRLGLSVKLRIVAERTLPAGRAVGATSAGAVPDEACDGEGLTRRCVAGMPFGVTEKGHDLSNIGARPGRVVHVGVDSEKDL